VFGDNCIVCFVQVEVYLMKKPPVTRVSFCLFWCRHNCVNFWQ